MTVLLGEGGSGSKGSLGASGKDVGSRQPKALGPPSCHLESPSLGPSGRLIFLESFSVVFSPLEFGFGLAVGVLVDL